MRDRANILREVIRTLINKPDNKILYIVPSIKYYHRYLLPEIKQLTKYISSLKLNLSGNVLSIKGKDGYILFRVPVVYRIRGIIADELFVDEAATIDEETYHEIKSFVRKK